MNRIVVKSKVDKDGVLHLDLNLGVQEADNEVQVTVEPTNTAAGRQTLRASDLLKSGLVGLWADRPDISDSRDFARRLREQAQTRRRQ